MSTALAVWLLVGIVGALSLSSVLFNRQQQAIVRGVQAEKLEQQVRKLDPLLAFLDVIGASLATKEAIHSLRQRLVRKLVDLAPDGGWAAELAEKAPESPSRPDGPFTLRSTQQIPQVQGMLVEAINYLNTRLKEPDVLAELNDLYALVSSDTLTHAAVEAVNQGKFHEARALLTKAKSVLGHPHLSGSIRLHREKRIQETAMAMAKRARQELENDLRDGSQIEQAFMEMLDLPAQ